MTPNERFNATDEPAESGRLAVVSLADVEPEFVKWLWPGRIPLGKLSVIAGIQGLGKSFLTLDMAARISNGTPWPDSRDDYNEQGSVILLSAEDALADTVRPRLDWAGANVNRIKAIEGTRNVDHEGQRSFDLQRDILLLSDLVEELGDVRLIVFDPIDSYLGQNVNPNRGNDIRRVLGPLAELADSSGAAVVAVAHLNKTPNTNALFRVCGSIAYTTIARAAWLVAEDKGEPQRRLFLKLKFNLSQAEPNLAFTINHGQVNWCDGYVEQTADEVMGEQPKNADEAPSKIAEAVEFLNEALAGGAMKATEIQKGAVENGVKKGTLDRAKSKLRIKPQLIRCANKQTWWWALPEGTQDQPDRNLAHLGDLAHLGHDRDTQGTQDTHRESIREQTVQTSFSHEQPSSDRAVTPKGCEKSSTAARDSSEPRLR